jgi:hypothetical protein
LAFFCDSEAGELLHFFMAFHSAAEQPALVKHGEDL